MRRRNSAGPQERRQPLHDLAQEGLIRQAVEFGVARRYEPDPEAPLFAAVYVVGKARQIVDDYLGRAGVRPAQPVTQDPVAAGFRDQQETLVAADGNAVGEIESVDEDAYVIVSGIESNYAPVSAVFEDVQQAGLVAAVPGFRTELRGCFGEIDDAVPGDGEIVRINERLGRLDGEEEVSTHLRSPGPRSPRAGP